MRQHLLNKSFAAALSMAIVLVTFITAHASYPSSGGFAFSGTVSGLTFDYGSYGNALQISGTGTSPATLIVTWTQEYSPSLPTPQTGFTITFDGANFSSNGGYARAGYGNDGTFLWYQEPYAVGSTNTLAFNVRQRASNGATSYQYGNSLTYNAVTGTFTTTTQTQFVITGAPAWSHKHWITLDTTAGSDAILVRFWTGNNTSPSVLGTSGTIRLIKTAACPSGGILSGGMCICTGPAAVAWTDPTITSNSTKIRKPHIDELRSQINIRRIDASLSAFVWSDATIVADSTKIRKPHFDEMRTAISQVYTACGQVAPSFSDPSLTANSTSIRATHILELRNAVDNAL